MRCRAQLPVNFLANSQSVTRSASVPHCGQTAADIIVVVDESKSMKPHYKERLHEAFTRLDVSLEEHGIGLYPGKPNQYTVVGFGHSEGRTSVNGVHRYVPHVLYSNNGRQVYDINGFQEACSKLQTTGSLEDGYLAMKFALEDITSGGRQLLRLRREDIAPVIIFISDEDRDTHQQGAGISRSAIKRIIRKSGATMEAIVDNNVWYNNQRGFGMDSSGTLYVAESTTRYTTSNPRFYKRYLDLHYRTTRRDYSSVALEVGGAAWDLNSILDSDVLFDSHVQAFVDKTVTMVEDKVHKCCSCQCSPGTEDRCLLCTYALSVGECNLPAVIAG